MIQTISLEQLDRTIFEYIRLELVKRGHLPNITEFSDKTAYENAKKNINILIEVFGTGVADSRDKKHAHSIIIDRKSITPDTLGGRTEFFKENKDENGEVTSFTKGKTPAGASNIDYDIRHITNSIKVNRIISSVMHAALGFGKQISVLEDDRTFGDKYVQCTFKGQTNVSSTDFDEELYKYTMNAVWLEDTEEILSTDVPVLKHIEINVNGKDPDVDGVKSFVGEPVD